MARVMFDITVKFLMTLGFSLFLDLDDPILAFRPALSNPIATSSMWAILQFLIDIYIISHAILVIVFLIGTVS